MDINELYRIKELMLYEQFGGNENMVPKYVERVIEKMGGEVPFATFLNGEASLREFRETLTEKIKGGDYGSDFGEVSKNLQYLKRVSGVFGTLKREYEKNPEKFDGLDGFLFGEDNASENPLDGLNEKVLYGEFCRSCKNVSEVNEKLEEVINAREKINDIEEEKAEEIENIRRRSSNPEEMEYLMKKLYGDSFGLLSFFSKGHIRRGQSILDKYNLRNSSIVSKGKNKVVIEVFKNVETDINGQNVMIFRQGKTYPTEYVKDEGYLIHKGEQLTVYIKIDTTPTVGGTYTGQVEKMVPTRNTDEIEVEPKSLKIKFEVVEGGKPGRPKNQSSK